jgi:hypothetical protein
MVRSIQIRFIPSDDEAVSIIDQTIVREMVPESSYAAAKRWGQIPDRRREDYKVRMSLDVYQPTVP